MSNHNTQMLVTFDANTGNAVGGMLVTDNTGIPLEFLITSAVRPTRAQQILYGNRLKRVARGCRYYSRPTLGTHGNST